MSQKPDKEVDFLLELEYRLQSQLDWVHERLEQVLPVADLAIRHLIIVKSPNDAA